MTPLLSILIPTVHGREESFIKLINKITGNNYDSVNWQDDKSDYYGEMYAHDSKIHILWHKDNKEITIGDKREGLYHGASGKYSWQIDDDDDISDDAIDLICGAILNKPSCITFQERCLINGERFISNHSLKYDDWAEKTDGYDYVRTPFMKSVIKTEIAQSVPVPHLRFGEDHEWAIALKPHLKNEIHIDKELYIYQHNSKPEEYSTRYGFDRD